MHVHFSQIRPAVANGNAVRVGSRRRWSRLVVMWTQRDAAGQPGVRLTHY
jgi:hypothetical protein